MSNNIYMAEKRERFSRIGMPEWLSVECSGCSTRLPLESILSVSVEFSPKMFGNISVSYVCEKCGSLIEHHYVKAFSRQGDLEVFLSADEPPSQPIHFSDVINSTGHNIEDDR